MFESPRARQAKSLLRRVSACMRLPLPGSRLCRGSNPREPFSIKITARGRIEAFVHGLSQGSALIDLLTLARQWSSGSVRAGAPVEEYRPQRYRWLLGRHCLADGQPVGSLQYGGEELDRTESQAGLAHSFRRSRLPMLHLPRQLSRRAGIQAITTKRM